MHKYNNDLVAYIRKEERREEIKTILREMLRVGLGLVLAYVIMLALFVFAG